VEPGGRNKLFASKTPKIYYFPYKKVEKHTFSTIPKGGGGGQ